MKIFYGIFLFICCLGWGVLRGQEVPFNYLQTNQNLYLMNPAIAAQNRQPTLSLDYHRQQIGSMDLVPQYSTIAFTSPLGNTRSSIGAAVYRYSRSYFVTNGFRASFAHAVPLAIDQYLSFSLTGGGSYSQLDVNISDPLVDRYNKSFQPEAEFGVAYLGKGWEIGASLTNLLGNALDNDANKYSFYTNYFTHIGYTMPVGIDWKVKPFAAYRTYTTNDITTDTWEGNVIVFYKDFIIAGGGYREEQGPYFTAGAQVKSITVSAAYKLAYGKESATNPAIELHLGYRFGKKREAYAKRTSEDKNQSGNDEAPIQATAEVKRRDHVEDQGNIKKDDKAKEESKTNDTGSPANEQKKSNQVPDKLETSLPEKLEAPISEKPVTVSKENKVEDQGKIKKEDKAEESKTNDTGSSVNEQRKSNQVPDKLATPLPEKLEAPSSEKPVTGLEEFKGKTDRDKEAYVEQIDAVENKQNESEISVGYYVVISAFKKRSNLDHYIADMAKKGYTVYYKYSSETLFYYAYLTEVQSISEGQLKLAILRNQDLFSDAWLLSVNLFEDQSPK